jgi:hypothetical protein
MTVAEQPNINRILDVVAKHGFLCVDIHYLAWSLSDMAHRFKQRVSRAFDWRRFVHIHFHAQLRANEGRRSEILWFPANAGAQLLTREKCFTPGYHSLHFMLPTS